VCALAIGNEFEALAVHLLACATIVWLLTSITLKEWTKVGLTLVVASVMFAVTRWNSARQHRAPG